MKDKPIKIVFIVLLVITIATVMIVSSGIKEAKPNDEQNIDDESSVTIVDSDPVVIYCDGSRQSIEKVSFDCPVGWFFTTIENDPYRVLLEKSVDSNSSFDGDDSENDSFASSHKTSDTRISFYKSDPKNSSIERIRSNSEDFTIISFGETTIFGIKATELVVTSDHVHEGEEESRKEFKRILNFELDDQFVELYAEGNITEQKVIDRVVNNFSF